MTFLLDVNVLIAAIWTNHVHHARGDGWIAGKSLALCPISELGFLRISSHPRGLGASMTDAKRLLEHFRVQNHAVFVPADIASTGIMAKRSDDLTDAYLADLAAQAKMRLAILDLKIRHAAVEVIS